MSEKKPETTKYLGLLKFTNLSIYVLEHVIVSPCYYTRFKNKIKYFYIKINNSIILIIHNNINNIVLFNLIHVLENCERV